MEPELEDLLQQARAAAKQHKDRTMSFGEQRRKIWAEALEHTAMPAWAKAGSTSLATSAGRAEKTSGTVTEAGAVGRTVSPATRSGMGSARIQ